MKNRRSKVGSMKDKKFFLPVYYLLILIYWEVMFKLLAVEKFFRPSLLNTFIYLITVSLVLSLISSFFSKKVNTWIMGIITFVLSLWFSVEFMFHKIFDVYFSVATIGLADQAATFWKDVVVYIFKYSYGILLMFLPFIFMFYLKKFINRDRLTAKRTILIFILALVSHFSFCVSLLIDKNKTYSAYELYYNVNDNSLNIQTLGVVPATTLEIQRAIFGFEENIGDLTVIKKEEEHSEEITYNITEIDFEALSEAESDETIKSMHSYFSQDIGTNKNEYTGYYEGKNLILFMAESFNGIAVSKELTPTLYKLTHESFVFENFYTPVILSTLGGEFQELTGLYPNLLNSVWQKGTNYFPYGYSNVFESLNYNTYAYHNNQYNFQSRDKYLKSLGFDNYLGCFNGLEKRINCGIWPESDVEMIETTVADYINSEEPFMTYYATVSGHMAYNWGNKMAAKNKAYVNDLDLSEKAKAYLATQIELDRALEKLINELEEAGKLEDTVIALVGDHYPYDLDLDTVNELSQFNLGTTRDKTIEINRSNFILWNSETPYTSVTKVGSQIDVLPTLLNLFGIKYDSRLIIGKDILSNEPGLAMFSDRSWVSDYGSYFASQHKFEARDGVEVSEDYVDLMNKVVSSKILMSKLILQEDYYKKVLGG